MPEPIESPARKLPISVDKFCEIIGISRTTIWRWEREGMLRTILIANRRYVPGEVVEEFSRRAAAGEFARPSPSPRSRGRREPKWC
jgi:hypothetical protein